MQASSEADHVLAQIFSPANHDNPYPYYARLRQLAPVHMSSTGVCYVSSHAAAHRVLYSREIGVETRFEALMPDWQDHPCVTRLARTLLMVEPPKHTHDICSFLNHRPKCVDAFLWISGTAAPSESDDMLSSWLSRRRFRRRLETISGHGNRIMWLIPLFVPVLLLVSYVERTAPSSGGSAVNSFVWGTASALVAGAFAFYRIERYRSMAFLRWLHEQRDALRTGRIEYCGHAITRSTEVTQYRVCTSMILFTVEFSTAFSFVARDGHRRSVVFPGPFYTIATVIRNIRGGHKRSVQELLNEMAADMEAPKLQ